MLISIIVIEFEQSGLVSRSRGMLPVIPSLFDRWCRSSDRDGRTVRGLFFLWEDGRHRDYPPIAESLRSRVRIMTSLSFPELGGGGRFVGYICYEIVPALIASRCAE